MDDDSNNENNKIGAPLFSLPESKEEDGNEQNKNTIDVDQPTLFCKLCKTNCGKNTLAENSYYIKKLLTDVADLKIKLNMELEFNTEFRKELDELRKEIFPKD